MDHNQLSQVSSFYTGRNVFLTGGSGFLGKLFIQKLLSVCPDVGGIYLLIRSKNAKNPEQRLEEIFNNALFDDLNKIKPDFKEKIHVIFGDIMYNAMGLNQSDRHMLIDKIHIVVHCAATVNFIEKIKQAVNINVRGTRDIVQLCKEMKNLKCMMYISTAYSNCNKLTIGEWFCNPPMQPDTLINLVNEVPEPVLDSLVPNLLGDWPNTYTYSKAVAEAVIQSHVYQLPIGVLKPSIVISTYKDPLQCWIDNAYGFVGYCMGVSMGIVRFIFCDNHVKLDLIPGDYVINTLLAAIPDVARQFEEKVENRNVLYNCVAAENTLPIADHVLKQLQNYVPFQYTYYKVINIFTSCYIWNLCLRVFLHYLPAIFIDGFCLLTGRKRRLFNIYTKIHKFMDALAFFSMRNFIIRNDNVVRLWNELSDVDKQLFQFNMKTLDWDDYYKEFAFGMKKYLLKDNMDEKSIKAAADRYKRFVWLHLILQVIFYTGCFYIVWLLFNKLYDV